MQAFLKHCLEICIAQIGPRALAKEVGSFLLKIPTFFFSVKMMQKSQKKLVEVGGGVQKTLAVKSIVSCISQNVFSDSVMLLNQFLHQFNKKVNKFL